MEIVEHKRYYVYKGICIKKQANGIRKSGNMFLVNIVVDEYMVEIIDDYGNLGVLIEEKFEYLGVVGNLIEAAEMYYQAFLRNENAKVAIVRYEQQPLFESNY